MTRKRTRKRYESADDDSRGLFSRLLPVVLVLTLLALLGYWLLPKRIALVITVDGEHSWPEGKAPAVRKFVWGPSTSIEVDNKHAAETTLPETPSPKTTSLNTPSVIRPVLTDGGATLYFALRLPGGTADIYRSRLVDGKWQPGKPFEPFNTPYDDIGLIFSADGQEAYFYSDRPNGYGGFDLYVSRRQKSDAEGAGWTPPENLGPKVNSPAHEYDPAISPDGELLFFSSNRTPAMQSRRGGGLADEKSDGKDADEPQEWSATLRARPGLTQFDLYLSRRDVKVGRWSAPSAVNSVNRDDSDEGSAAVSPDGAYLYFASDRPQRQGEARNFDLYRARLSDGEVSDVETLGETVNTSSDEMEPALSPEGFTLLYSSDREHDGTFSLYRSRAKEVVEQVIWNNANWQAFSAMWMWVALLLLLLLGAVLLFRYSSEWMTEKAVAARFFMASFLVHLMLVLLAGFLTLGKAVLEKRAEIIEVMGIQVLDDSQHQSHEAGQEAYEKTGDLPSIQDIVTPETVRQITMTPNIPHPTNTRIANIPTIRVRRAPQELTVTEPVHPEASERTPLEMQRRQATLPRNDVASQPLTAEPLTPELTPTQRPMARVVKVDRQPAPENVATTPNASAAEIPRRAVKAKIASGETRPVLPKMAALPRRPLAAAPVRSPGKLSPVEPESPAELVRVSAAKQPLEVKVAADASVNRKAESPAKPNTNVTSNSPVPLKEARPVRDLASRRTITTRLPSSGGQALQIPRTASKIAKLTRDPVSALSKSETALGAEINAETSLKGNPTNVAVARRGENLPSPANIARGSANPSTALPRASNSKQTLPAAPGQRRVANLVRATGRSTQPAALENSTVAGPVMANDAPVETRPDGTVKLARRQTLNASAPVPTPRKPGGRQNPNLAVGRLSEKSVDAPSAFHPHISRLQRKPAEATPVAYAVDSIGTRALFMLREGATRREIVKISGGNDQSEAAIRLGLVWLAKHQHADGHWGLHDFNAACKNHPKCSGHGSTQSAAAATGLALLPFLGTGQTHKSGEYQKVVQQGLDWLIKNQKPDGDLFTGGGNAHMYSHGIAAIALCEAYGMTQDPRLRQPAQKALDFIVSAQHKGDGGWRYKPGQAGDTSVVGWQVMAVKSGEMAGLRVPQSTFQLANKWLDSAEAPKGQFGYTGRGSKPAMTAEGLLCRQFLGAKRNSPGLRAGAEYLSKRLPKMGQDTSYYWYYATQVMYHMQGDHWKKWNDVMRDLLVNTQLKSGSLAGTWEPRDQWEKSGGRIYATSLRLLILEVYYRHLPLYRQLGD